MMSIDHLKKRYETAGQGHLLKFWDGLSPADQKSLSAQLEALDIERVNRIYKKAIVTEAASNDSAAQAEAIEPLPRDATDSIVGNSEKQQEWRQIGLDAVSRGCVGVLLMAGGQGTRLGSSAPKGCYDIGLPSHKSLFQYQAERIARLQRVAELENGKQAGSVIVPWYVMTSGPTRRDTEEFFIKNSYFGLNAADIIFFEQGIFPLFSCRSDPFIDNTPHRHSSLSDDGRQGPSRYPFSHCRGP